MMTEREQSLIARSLDGSLSTDEQREFDRVMKAHPDVRREMESLRSMKEVTMELQFKKPPEEQWARYWAGVYARLERGVAWVLISIGGALVLAVAAYRMVEVLVQDTAMPLLMKLGIVALVLGGAILLVSVVREKWFLRKSDRYREVER
jgi:anti-sigma factor RsiW